MIIYCPSCWRQNQEVDKVCAACGTKLKLKIAGLRDFTAKLIGALNHPEPATPVRAATILGKLRDKRAVEPLIKLARNSQDPYILESAIAALGEIGSPKAIDILIEKSNESYLIVRIAAVKSLGQIGGAKADQALLKALLAENRQVAEMAEKYMKSNCSK